MIWHDYIFINDCIRVLTRDLVDQFFCYLPESFWDGKPVPYDLTECVLPLMCADRNKIRAILTVIIIDYSVIFSCPELQICSSFT